MFKLTLVIAAKLEESIPPLKQNAIGTSDLSLRLIDFSIRTGAPLEVVENLQSMEDEEDVYESIEEIWPDFPTEEDYLWNEDEY